MEYEKIFEAAKEYSNDLKSIISGFEQSLALTAFIKGAQWMKQQQQPDVSDKVLDKILEELDIFANDYSQSYGLPTHRHRDKLRQIIREHLTPDRLVDTD